jgi:hypothetical protein
MPDVLSILVAARAEVDAGWCKNVAVDYHGNVCAVGALETALGVEKVPRQHTMCCVTTREARAALRNALPARHVGIPWFNDDPHTTKADVLALFDRAIAAEAVKVTADPAHTYTVAA